MAYNTEFDIWPFNVYLTKSFNVLGNTRMDFRLMVHSNKIWLYFPCWAWVYWMVTHFYLIFLWKLKVNYIEHKLLAIFGPIKMIISAKISYKMLWKLLKRLSLGLFFKHNQTTWYSKILNNYSKHSQNSVHQLILHIRWHWMLPIFSFWIFISTLLAQC